MKLVRNLLSMSAMRITSALLTLSLVVYCARTWGVTQLGQLALLTTVFLFCQLLPLMGLHLYLIREVAARPETVDLHAPNAALFAALISPLLCVGIGFGGQWLYSDQPILQVPIWLIGLSLLPTAPIAVAEALLLARQRMDVIAHFNILENIARTAVSLILVFSGAGLSEIFTVFLIGRILIAWGYLHNGETPRLIRRKAISKAILRDYLQRLPVFFGIVVCAALVMRLDVLLLSRLSSPQELGLYASPFKLYELGLMVPQILMVVLFPHLSALFAKSSDCMMKMAASAIRYPLLVAWPLLLLLATFASDVLRPFGFEARQGAPALSLLLIALVGRGVDQLLAVCMLVANRADLDLRTLIVAAVLTTLLLILCIPLQGSAGAAAVVMSMSVISPLLRAYWMTSVLPMKVIWIAIRDTTLAALTMAGAMLLLWPLGRFLACTGGLLSYAIVLYFQGLPTWAEIRTSLNSSSVAPT